MAHDQSHFDTTFAGCPQFNSTTKNTRGHWERYGNNGSNWGDIRIGPKGSISFDFTEVGNKNHAKRTMIHLDEPTAKALMEFILKNFPSSP